MRRRILRNSFIVLSFLSLHQFAFSQTLTVIGSQLGTSSTAGPTTSTTGGVRTERHTAIYSATELTAAGFGAGNAIMNIAWEKTGVGFYYENNLSIRVWLKHSTVTAFPANPNFATETSTATLVYQNLSANIPQPSGWMMLNFNTATPFFTWNGTDHLQVITEIIRPTDWNSTSFLWRTTTAVTNGAANGNGTTAPATLTRTSTRPQVRLGRSTTGDDAAIVGIVDPVDGPAGTQNINVTLQNTGTTTLVSANLEFTVNAGAPVTFPWSGSLAPGATANVVIGSNSFANGTNTIVATASVPNGGTDADPANNSFTKIIQTCSPLAGNYTINQGAPASATNFTSFNAFAAALTSCGVGGNVTATVTVGSGPYNEQVIFRDIAGLSAASTVTIQGSDETITAPAPILTTNSNPDRHIIRLRDISYFTINDLNINMPTGSTAFMGVNVYLAGHHITVSNCSFDMTPGTSTLMGAMVASSLPASLLEEGPFTDLTFTGNTSTGGGYGVAVNGATAGSATGIVVTNNTFTGTTSNGVYMQNTNGVQISGNTINFSGSNGIQLAQGGNINGLINGNFISCTNPTSTGIFRGIYIFASAPGTPNKVTNNLISQMNAPAADIIGIANRTTGAEFYFNTVILDQPGSTGEFTFGFEEDLANVQSMLRNNIFYITRSSSVYGAAIALFPTSDPTSTINSDYNVFFVGNGNHVAVREGSGTNPPNNIYATLADWRTASGEDFNSFETDPQFQAGTGIPSSGVINGQGITIAGITTDILGTTRTSPPDPGAYEFAPPAGDAAITNFISPPKPHCATTLDVQFELTNAGSDPLNTVTINWTVNGVPQAVVNWAGPTLASGASTIVTLGTIPVTGTNAYDFSATSSNPNGSADVNPANDTHTYTGFRRGLEGTFTIDQLSPASATNFTSFQAAADMLSLYGICSPVVINVLNGPYNEQVVFNAVPGTSGTNTITLDGNNQVLQFNPTVANDDHILQLDAVEHMIVQNLTVSSFSPTMGRGIHITNGASKLAILDNTVNVSISNDVSSTFGIIISGENWLLDGSLSDSVVIRGNTVRGGYSSIQLSGEHWTQPLTRIVVEENEALDWYGFGIYLSYTNNAIIRSNTIRRPLRTNSGSDAVTPAGITIPAGSLGFMLDKNRIYDLHVNMVGTPTISRGVYLSGTPIAPTSGTIQNNLIYGMRNDGAQYGIQDNSQNGPINIYHNTIVLDGPTGASTSNTNAINLSNSSPQFFTNIVNNIFVVTRGGTGIKRIIDVGDDASVFTSNYNVSYINTIGGTQTFAQLGSTNYTTLADWQAGTPHDDNTVSLDPVFTNPGTGDFTPTNFLVDGSTMLTSSVGVTDDILGAARSANPDPGAFETNPPPCDGADGGTASALITSFCSSGSTTLSSTGFSSGLGTSYQWEYSSDNFVSDINDLTGETNPLSANTGTISATTYYRLRVTCNNGPVVDYSNTVTIIVGNSITTQPQNQAVCEGSPVSFTVVVNGSSLSYQWRKNTVNISGANAATFTILSVTAADAGNYDVVISSPCGDLTSTTASLTVTAPGSWTGQIDSDWFKPGNWCGGVPTPTTDITIPNIPNLPMPILVGGIGTARKITINGPNGELHVGTGGTLEVYGDVINSGYWEAISGTFSFRGASSQSIPSFSARSVIMNGAGIVLGGNSLIFGSLQLTNGNITLGSSDLLLRVGATGSPSSHIVTNGSGDVIASAFAAGDSRTVPIGVDPASYNPITITANAGHVLDNLRVNVQAGAFVNGIAGPTYTAYVVNRTWNISEESNGGSNLDITVQWVAGEELNNFDRTRSYIAHNIGGIWMHDTPVPALGTNPYTQSRQNITTFSPFIVRNEPIPTPRRGIYPNPTRDDLYVVMLLSAQTPVYFSVFDAAGSLVHQERVTVSSGLTQTALDLRKLSSGTYTLRVSTPTNPNYMVEKFIRSH